MESVARRKWFGHTDRVTGVAISRDQTRALTTSNDGTAKLWDLTTVPAIGETLFYSHTGEARTHIRPLASPDGRWLAHIAFDNGGDSVYVDDLHHQTDRRILHVPGSHMGMPQFTPDGRRIFVREGNSLAWWSVETGAGPTYEPVPETGDYYLLPDGTHAVLAHGTKPSFQIGVWDLHSHYMTRNLGGSIPFVHRIALLPDHRTLVVSSESGFPRLIDLESGEQRLLENTFSNKNNYAVPHPFQNRVVLIGESRKPIWYDVQSDEVSQIPIDLEGIFQPISISDDGGLMAACLRPGSSSEQAGTASVFWMSPRITSCTRCSPRGLEPTGVTWLPDSRSLAATLKPQVDSEPYMIVWQLSDASRPAPRAALNGR